MLIGPHNFAAHRTWFLFVLAATAAAIGWYVAAAWQAEALPGGSSLPGLTFGILAGGIILFEMLLWPRKKIRAWRIGHANTWLKAHLWLGILSLPLAVLHSGFHFGGPLSTVLLTLFLIVIASGIAGLALQQWLPRMLLDQVPAETIYSQIEYVAKEHCYDAEDLVVAACGPDPTGRRLQRPGSQSDERRASDHLVVGALRSVGNVRGRVLQSRSKLTTIAHAQLLRDSFYTTIAPYLEHGARSNSPLRRADDARRHFQLLAGQVDQEARTLVDTLESLCEQRRQFELQARLHFVLHGWLWVHVPLSVALTVLLFLHAYVALKYL